MLRFGVFRIALLMGRRQLALAKFGVRPTRWWRKRASNFWSHLREDNRTPSSPLRFFGPGCTGCDRYFISENDDF